MKFRAALFLILALAWRAACADVLIAPGDTMVLSPNTTLTSLGEDDAPWNALLDICIPSPVCSLRYGQRYGRNLPLFRHVFLATTRMAEPLFLEQPIALAINGKDLAQANAVIALWLMEADAADPTKFGCAPYQSPIFLESGAVQCDDPADLKGGGLSTPSNLTGLITMIFVIVLLSFAIELFRLVGKHVMRDEARTHAS